MYVQLQFVTGVSSTGGESLTVNLICPQWHLPEYSWDLGLLPPAEVGGSSAMVD